MDSVGLHANLNFSMIDTTNSRGTDISIPAATQTYNYTMGGVDVGDEMIQQFEPQFNSLKIWRKMLFNFLLQLQVHLFILHFKSDLLKFYVFMIPYGCLFFR